MVITDKDNKIYECLRDNFNNILPEQRMFFATSGHGKGLALEQFIEKWKESTGGVVIYLADPKDEAEGTFVMYEPKERYHVEKLKSDGSRPTKHKCKIYHPFTFNIPKGYLPDINFFTIPLKSLGREEWSILAESSWDSEAIKLLLRCGDNLSRNKGLFEFLLDVEKLVDGNKDKKKNTRDMKNFGLKVGGGTAKSLTEIAGLLHPFRINYFLRKESCPNSLNWEKILTDTESYHVFLSMWLKDEKLKEFMVLTLLEQIIENRQYAKTQILLVIPEVRFLCPRNPQGYKFFLSNAIANKLSTIRSQGRGISSVLDSQVWFDTDDKIKGSATITYFGKLSTRDQEAVKKAMTYKRDIYENLLNMKQNTYYIAGHEDSGLFRFFFPRHMHKEPSYNWIETYRKNNLNMVKYNELVSYMRKELDDEENIVRELIKKEIEDNRKISEEKKKAKEERDEKKTPVKREVDDEDKDFKARLIYEMFNDSSLSSREKSWRSIGRKYGVSHLTAKKYYEYWVNKLELGKESDNYSLSNMLGEGVSMEEVEE